MKRLISTIFFFVIAVPAFSQTGPGTWTWIRGDSMGITSSYGTQGIPSPSNNPAMFYEAPEWTDTSGNFWLMVENNLWKYEPAIDMWTWMKGPGTDGDSGHYGTYRIASPQNLPPARAYGCLAWTDLNNNLWLYGGWTTNMFDICVYKDDLWRYNISTNEWTWMHGTSACFAQPVFGTKGISAPANRPGGRNETACSWVDATGNLWLFGGARQSGVANDFWMYDLSINEWTWIAGDSLTNVAPVYGTYGIAAAANTPGGRCVYSRWKDANGDFWIMGGNGYDPNTNSAHYADLWKFSHASDWWTWMGGSMIPFDASKHYGQQGIASPANHPSCRVENRACWTDSCGNFWMYGGIAFENVNWQYVATGDLWKYDPYSEMWAWISGDSVYNSFAQRGQMNIASVNNRPGNNNGSAPWVDKQGNFWMMGGFGYGSNIGNVLWKYTPAVDNCTQIKSVEELNPPDAFTIFPNPGTGIFQLNISMENAETIEINIYDEPGRLVYSKKENANAGNFSSQLNLSGFSAGVYLVQVKTAAGNATRRLVIE